MKVAGGGRKAHIQFSGALITANFATEYGWQVFAVPGRLDSPAAKGVTISSKKA